MKTAWVSTQSMIRSCGGSQLAGRCGLGGPRGRIAGHKAHTRTDCREGKSFRYVFALGGWAALYRAETIDLQNGELPQ